MRIAFIQPQIPHYRVPFFHLLSKQENLFLKVYSSAGHLGKITEITERYEWMHILGKYKKLYFGVDWQEGLFSINFDKYDAFVIAGNPRNIPALIFTTIARLKGKKVVWLGHYMSINSSKFLSAIRHFLYLIPKNICFYTKAEYEKANAELAKYKLNLDYISNGLDISEIKKYRENFSFEKRKYNILLIGRLTPRVKTSNIFHAVSKLKNKEVQLHIIGEGESKHYLQNLAKKLNLEENIFFYGSLIEEREISKIANKCSLFLSSDCVGLSLIHALSYGIPALINGNRRTQGPEADIMHLGQIGGFHNGSIESLSKTIDAFFASGESLNNYSKNAIRVMNSNHNIDIMVERIISLLSDLK